MEFQAFESLLCAPDAISQLSFKLFDIDQSGKVSYGKNFSIYYPTFSQISACFLNNSFSLIEFQSVILEKSDCSLSSLNARLYYTTVETLYPSSMLGVQIRIIEQT